MIDEAYAVTGVASVGDAAYGPVVTGLVDRAEHRMLASLFIVDLTPPGTEDLLVDDLLIALQAARWRGVDVRLLLGGSRDNTDIALVALTAFRRARQLGLPARLLAARPVRGSHVKLVVADDTVLTGSHNWSHGAFTDETQDSVLVDSVALAEAMARVFADQWERAAP